MVILYQGLREEGRMSTRPTFLATRQKKFDGWSVDSGSLVFDLRHQNFAVGGNTRIGYRE